jgi:amino acid transporter
VNLALGAVLLVVTTAVTTSVMLLVRRRAPEGSYFSDGDRAAGVFGVIATGFSVLVGFIIFLAFESYDASRSGAETEATTVLQQAETAQFMSPKTAEELTGELVCYGRSVVSKEWPAMEDGSIGNSVNPWGVEMFRSVRSLVPQTAPQQSAYDRWMAQTATREQARQDRVHGAEGVLPWPLWVVLLALSCLIFTFMLFFADSAELAATQGLMMACVTLVVTLLLFLLVFFDRPHGEGSGKLGPTAMERSLALIDTELKLVQISVTLPCDSRGDAR